MHRTNFIHILLPFFFCYPLAFFFSFLSCLLCHRLYIFIVYVDFFFYKLLYTYLIRLQTELYISIVSVDTSCCTLNLENSLHMIHINC